MTGSFNKLSLDREGRATIVLELPNGRPHTICVSTDTSFVWRGGGSINLVAAFQIIRNFCSKEILINHIGNIVTIITE